ncbi:transglycosylase SLT domain-containing protein [Acetobacter estunensis]|uniref:transglycosylase SLT domain-containing protein n=1 Tax=Acetobacter estunensis TaxID=104097 RepID=UPI001C2D67FE|nr:transglycosylase SLT domain-containing protein [Acetobacter estunensis]MBV1837639.1 transglycosylase SLT domain-containing protein [Acetobacter estunensis]
MRRTLFLLAFSAYGIPACAWGAAFPLLPLKAASAPQNPQPLPSGTPDPAQQLAAFLHAPATPQNAFPIDPGAGMACIRAALTAERSYRIPDQFLVAMARVESGRRVGGQMVPWPWTINAEGKGYTFETRQQAIDAVHALQSRGVKSIDVGCMQVNLLQHADAFPSLEAAFDPMTNATYAARFLTDLFARTGSWPRAAAAYHSFTPDIGTAYQWKVLESWATPNTPTQPGTHPVMGRSFHPIAPTAPTSAPVTAYQTAAGSAASLAAQGGQSPQGGGGPSTSSLHPGIHGYSPPPSRPSLPSGGSGRSLAFYRANPVHMIRQTMINPAPY